MQCRTIKNPYRKKESAPGERSRTKKRADSAGFYLKDNRKHESIQRKIEDNSNKPVVQAMGWEWLSYLNPFSYFSFWQNNPQEAPTDAAAAAVNGSAGQEQMLQDEALIAPLETRTEENQAPPPLLLDDSESEEAELFDMGKQEAFASGSEEDLLLEAPGPLKRKKKKKKKKKKRNKSAPEDKWTAVGLSPEEKLQEFKQRQERRQIKQDFVQGLPLGLSKWANKSDDGGTRRMDGGGSSVEHNIEVNARAALLDARPDDAIAFLQDAIEARTASLQDDGDEFQRVQHEKAITFLERKIEDIRRLLG